jgi:hypothetical protein
MILVLSNHNMDPISHVTGDWKVSPDDTGCGTVTDTLAYTSLREIGAAGDDYYAVVHETMTLRVSLKSAPGGSETALPFLNDNSTYEAEYNSHTALVVGPGCSTISDTEGKGAGPIPTEDGVVAWVMQQDDGKWIMTVASGVDIDVTLITTSCIGGDTQTTTQPIGLPDCDGTEIVGSGPARTFDFNCTGSGEWTWSLTGKVTLHL